MLTLKRLLLLLFILVFVQACTNASRTKQKKEEKKPDYSNWVSLTEGMQYREITAPKKSFIGDSKLAILRMDPAKFRFDLFAATQHDSIPKTVSKWAATKDLMVAFNACMYEQTKPLQSRAYLQNGKHINNGKLLEQFNLMLALGPKPGNNRSNIEVLDLTCANWEQEKQKFKGFAQGLRMIDCNGSQCTGRKKFSLVACSLQLKIKKVGFISFLRVRHTPTTSSSISCVKCRGACTMPFTSKEGLKQVCISRSMAIISEK